MSKMLEKKLWAAWLSVPGIGRETFAKLLDWSNQKQVSLVELWQKPSAAILSQRQQASVTAFQKQYSLDGYWQFLIQLQIQIITINENAYPEKLRQIYDPPWLLFVKGKLTNEGVTVGVVGTRRNTLYGEQVTKKIVQELAGRDVTIVSGFMYGIDTIAHKQAIDSQGKTVAVLGYGFGQVTPASHRELYHAWLASPSQVTFISEYPPSRKPKPGLFPLRNRIVAGLSDAVVVTEAAARSGSLITAQLALDNGRSVCAVPGSIFSRYSQGTKQLINQGACLVSSGYQVLEELGFTVASGKSFTKEECGGPLRQKIFQELSASSQTAEELSQVLQVPIGQLLSQFAELEIEGVIQRQGGLFCLAR